MTGAIARVQLFGHREEVTKAKGLVWVRSQYNRSCQGFL